MMKYFYGWNNNEKRRKLYKRRCRIVAVGKMNSCLIEFEDGHKEIVSRNAVKKLKGAGHEISRSSQNGLFSDPAESD